MTFEKPSESEIPQPKERETAFNFEEIEELQRYFDPIVSELKHEIEEGVYGILISDEASARIPTLVLREVMKRVAGEAPKTFFVPGPRNYDIKIDAKFLDGLTQEAQQQLDKKALLVTEYISTGGSIKQILKQLAERGIHPDVAVGSSSCAEKTLNRTDTRFIVGIDNNEYPPRIYGHRKLGGVEKIEWNDVAKLIPYKDYVTEYPDDGDEENSIQDEVADAIKKARMDVKLLAEHIIEKVWGAQREAEENAQQAA